MRLRLQYSAWPRPAIEVTDTPRPDCQVCDGEGGWTQDYGHPDTGEYDGTETALCDCWNPARLLVLAPVPRWIARRWLGYAEPLYNTEPPF